MDNVFSTGHNLWQILSPFVLINGLNVSTFWTNRQERLFSFHTLNYFLLATATVYQLVFCQKVSDIELLSNSLASIIVFLKSFVSVCRAPNCFSSRQLSKRLFYHILGLVSDSTTFLSVLFGWGVLTVELFGVYGKIPSFSDRFFTLISSPSWILNIHSRKMVVNLVNSFVVILLTSLLMQNSKVTEKCTSWAKKPCSITRSFSGDSWQSLVVLFAIQACKLRSICPVGRKGVIIQVVLFHM